MRRIIYLIREGQADPGAVEEAPLSEIGVQQATHTAHALRDLPIRAIYCSPRLSSLETADIIALEFADIVARPDPVLREIEQAFSPLDIDPLSPEEIPEASDYLAQVEEAFDAYFWPGGDEEEQEVLVCHQDMIRELICFGLGVHADSWAHMLFNHCGISCVSIEQDGTVELVAHNDVKHLPEQLRTGS